MGLYLVLAVAWVCWTAGEIYDIHKRRKADAAEMDRLDQWATETEQRMKGRVA